MTEKWLMEHIFLNNIKQSFPYKVIGGGANSPLPDRNRDTHGYFLKEKFSQIWNDGSNEKQERQAVALPSKQGYYVEFKSHIGYALATKSLECTNKKIRLLNIRTELIENQSEVFATVYIPNGQTGYFLEKVNSYLYSNTGKGKPKNQTLIDSIEDVLYASQLNSFWTDCIDLLPDKKFQWCETWLVFDESASPDELLVDFSNLCKTLNIDIKPNHLHFPERIVVLVFANEHSLIELIKSSDNIAEFRRAQETNSLWFDLRNTEQLEWIDDLSRRLIINETNTVVSVLDGGANNGHPLLSPVLRDANCLSINNEWGTHDSRHDGHGTLMCGVVAYNDLNLHLQHNGPVEINHQLESVKLLPPFNQEQNPYELWGDFTSQAISIAEINDPTKDRIFCMAITGLIGTDKGQPSSWSGALDMLTSGYEDEQQRLIIVSAGNLACELNDMSYPKSNIEAPVQNPAQSWNALSVGAFTNKTFIEDLSFQEYTPIAPAGGLSPFSTTSVKWNYDWPNKPEVLFEGGNLSKAPDGEIIDHEDLCSISTHKNTHIKQFQAFKATSEATAHAGWFSAQIKSKYTNAWPQTLKGLMIHSADWTETMKQQFISEPDNRKGFIPLLRTCGYGIPNLSKALNSINNSLTLIIQEEIQPFKDDGSLNEMHFYNIPWPSEELLNLSNVIVKLKVTLCYFIEPSPGQIGWSDRYRYQSFGLRFELNNPSETIDEFKARINVCSRDENFQQASSDSSRWKIGKSNRNKGSIHSDYIETTAAELATCNLIGVYPIGGWWKDRKPLKRTNKTTRYSLIISIETPIEEVDLLTPILTKIKIPVSIEL